MTASELATFMVEAGIDDMDECPMGNAGHFVMLPHTDGTGPNCQGTGTIPQVILGTS